MSATAPVTIPPPVQDAAGTSRPISLPLFVGLVLAGLSGLFVYLAFYLAKGAYGSDWHTFYAAAERWRDGGQVYTTADGFYNPPPTLLLLRLFIVLPYLPSRYLWGFLSAIMLLVSAWLTADALDWRPNTRTILLGGWWILVSVPCVLLAPLTGNWSALILLSYTLAVWLFYRGREGAAGAVLALTLVKPQLALFTLPLLIYKRRWRACAAYLAACTVVLLVSVPLIGLQTFGDYLQVERSIADWTLTNDALQRDVPGIHGMFLQHWPQSVSASTIANLISLGLACGLAWFWRGPWQPRSHRFVIGWALLLLVTLEASGYAHSYDLVLLVPACVALFVIANEQEQLRIPAKATLIALYVAPALVLLFRQHFMVPAMLAAIAVLWVAGARAVRA